MPRPPEGLQPGVYRPPDISQSDVSRPPDISPYGGIDRSRDVARSGFDRSREAAPYASDRSRGAAPPGIDRPRDVPAHVFDRDATPYATDRSRGAAPPALDRFRDAAAYDSGRDAALSGSDRSRDVFPPGFDRPRDTAAYGFDRTRDVTVFDPSRDGAAYGFDRPRDTAVYGFHRSSEAAPPAFGPPRDGFPLPLYDVRNARAASPTQAAWDLQRPRAASPPPVMGDLHPRLMRPPMGAPPYLGAAHGAVAHTGRVDTPPAFNGTGSFCQWATQCYAFYVIKSLAGVLDGTDRDPLNCTLAYSMLTLALKDKPLYLINRAGGDCHTAWRLLHQHYANSNPASVLIKRAKLFQLRWGPAETLDSFQTTILQLHQDILHADPRASLDDATLRDLVVSKLPGSQFGARIAMMALPSHETYWRCSTICVCWNLASMVTTRPMRLQLPWQ